MFFRGLPCRHMIEEIVAEHGEPSLLDVYSQWHLPSESCEINEMNVESQPPLSSIVDLTASPKRKFVGI